MTKTLKRTKKAYCITLSDKSIANIETLNKIVGKAFSRSSLIEDLIEDFIKRNEKNLNLKFHKIDDKGYIVEMTNEEIEERLKKSKEKKK